MREENDVDYPGAISKHYRQVSVDSEVDGPLADTQRAAGCIQIYDRYFSLFRNFTILHSMATASRDGFRTKKAGKIFRLF